MKFLRVGYYLNSFLGIVLIPVGVWSTIGVTGLIYGGRCGSLRRKYGLIADNVLAARMVDVYGNILDRKTGKEDLFWTIRDFCFGSSKWTRYQAPATDHSGRDDHVLGWKFC
ncbi:hypothetical protein POM88_047189 [Heracleum sosnowskyi]|uniref:Uncharacterized protein n=1 Tax=Heracleum sosnowskyi TaxID=360622 RepID=A0AAD8M5A8_9APIA|nr:hypothetical protein POM88_047189 [Heracleum sosnowskyi]